MSRGRIRRSPWSPRRRRTRERTLSLTRSPSPRRRHRSPMRYRSPLRSPPRSLPRSPVRSPVRSPRPLVPLSPPRSPRRSAVRSPPRSSPHRFVGVYDELLSPPRRSVEPPFGARYGPRNGPPPGYPPVAGKPMPLMAIPIQNDPTGFRGRYDAPPFEDHPPGVEPAVPGFEPSPFEKPPFGPSNALERDRMPPNFRDPYRPPFDGPAGYRDGMPLGPNDIPVHGPDHPRYRENFRPGNSYRDQSGVPYRDGQPYRDGNYRGGPPPYRDGAYRNHPYRDGNFRDAPHFREAGVPFRPPSADPRDSGPIPYIDPNFRDGYRDDNNLNREMRPHMRRGGFRRNIEHERHRERDGRERDRERYNEPSERSERPKDDKRSGYDKGRENRDDRGREYDRAREYEKERDKVSPEKKSRGSPKRSREGREKRRSESRGRSRERDSKREKKEERSRDKSSSDRIKDHKEKDKKVKDRKKKKREKEKEVEKKKKRDKKEKKDKESIKKDDEENGDDKIETDKQEDLQKSEEKEAGVKQECGNKEISSELQSNNIENVKDDLYGDEAAEAVDKKIIENYVKSDNDDKPENKASDTSKEEPFDGIELEAATDELDVDMEANTENKEMLAPLPALSKWEVEDENTEKAKEPGEITSPDEDADGSKVTSEVIKRAENAIFAKAINSLRPIEIKKISSDRLKLYGDENQSKGNINNIQITVPVTTESEQRSVESSDRKRKISKTPPPRLSVKERLGGKVEDVRRVKEPRVVHSTVERVKSRSKTPSQTREHQLYRRVTVDRERDRGRKNENVERRTEERLESFTPNIEAKKKIQKSSKEEKRNTGQEADKKSIEAKPESPIKAEHERKKSTLDESHFEPDYDENVESETDGKDEHAKKRERSNEPSGITDSKKPKIDTDSIKLDLTNVKKKRETDTESSSDSDDSSSSSSSDARKRKKKKKRAKKKKKKAASDSESESDSSSDDHKKKKKKRKHKKKSSKKKKKSKHK